MKEKNLEALFANMDILNAGLDVYHILNEKTMSLILQYDILETVGTYLIFKYA